MVALGTFILAFGWFGFNPGSTLAGTDSRIAIVAVNTMLASASGAFGAYLWTKFRFGAPDLSMLCNGMLAGLVAITAPCAFVTAPASIFIGLVAGVLVIVSAMFIENSLKIDDPVGASSVHGVCGAWGILSVGLFADGRYGDGWNGVPGTVRGLFYGDASQLAASCLGILVNIAWVGTMTFIALRVVGAFTPNRVSAEDETIGLDVPEMGVTVLKATAKTPRYRQGWPNCPSFTRRCRPRLQSRPFAFAPTFAGAACGTSSRWNALPGPVAWCR
jgi:Amt family ammonium transporter